MAREIVNIDVDGRLEQKNDRLKTFLSPFISGSYGILLTGV